MLSLPPDTTFEIVLADLLDAAGDSVSGATVTVALHDAAGEAIGDPIEAIEDATTPGTYRAIVPADTPLTSGRVVQIRAVAQASSWQATFRAAARVQHL